MNAPARSRRHFFLLQASLLVLWTSAGCIGGARHLVGDEPLPQALQRTYFDALNNAQKGDLEKAYTGFSDCLDREPSSAVFSFELARIDFAREAFEDASMHINLAVKLAPKNVWYRELRAKIYLHLRRFDNAIDDISFVLDVRKNPEELAFWIREMSARTGEKDRHWVLPIYAYYDTQFGHDRHSALSHMQALWVANEFDAYWKRSDELLARFPHDTELTMMRWNARYFGNIGREEKVWIAQEMGQFVGQLPRDATTVHLALQYGAPMMHLGDWMKNGQYVVRLALETQPAVNAHQLAYFLGRLMAKNPGDNPSSFSAVELEALATWNAHQPVILALCTKWLTGVDGDLTPAIRVAKMWRTAGSDQEEAWSSSATLFASQFDKTGEAHADWLDVIKGWTARYPMSCRAFYNLALAQSAEGQFDEALVPLSRSRKLNFDQDPGLTDDLNALEILILSR